MVDSRGNSVWRTALQHTTVGSLRFMRLESDWATRQGKKKQCQGPKQAEVKTKKEEKRGGEEALVTTIRSQCPCALGAVLAYTPARRD